MGGYQDADSSATKQGTQETKEVLQELVDAVKRVETAVDRFNTDSSRLGRWMIGLSIAMTLLALLSAISYLQALIFMSEPIFWVWNGWGIFFTAAYALQLVAYIGVVRKLGATPLRVPIAILGWICVILVFVLSGWIAGLIAIPLGLVVGPQLARFLWPPSGGVK